MTVRWFGFVYINFKKLNATKNDSRIKQHNFLQETELTQLCAFPVLKSCANRILELNALRCEGSIYVSYHQVISLTFINMSIESQRRCDYDYMEIYNGDELVKTNFLWRSKINFVVSLNLVQFRYYQFLEGTWAQMVSYLNGFVAKKRPKTSSSMSNNKKQ